MDLAKIFIVVLIFIVLFCLFRALYFMVTAKGKEQADGVANFLTLRVTFSAVLIGFLVLANYQGWIKFHGPHQDPRLIHQIEQNQAEDKTKTITE
ncbi:MAG: branched-subunit amino acid transport protein AzlD [Methylophagaceae bacterium]